MRWALAAASALLAAGAIGWTLRTPAPADPALTAAFMAPLDVDGDGSISLLEYARADDGRLPMSILDLDGSGALEPWEVEQAMLRLSPSIPQQNLLPMVR